MQKLKFLLTPRVPDDIGEVHVEWKFPEYVSQPRSRVWYLVASGLLGLLILYAVWVANYLFAVILVLSVLIILYQYFQEARLVDVRIGEDGIIVDNKFYPWKILKCFWLVYNPPAAKFLYLEFKTKIQKYLPIPLQDINPLELREILLNYLNEDINKDEEEFDDTIARLLKMR